MSVHPAVRRCRTFLACAVVAATMLACGIDGGEPQEVDTASDATICNIRKAGDPWWVTTYPVQTTKFHSEFQATPSATNIDAVVGFSKGAASRWTQLAAIVRFAPTGVIDVRKGGAYAADVSYPYFANTTYFIRVDIDIPTHTYSVSVRQNMTDAYTMIARSFPFRTEQASVTSLDAGAVYLEPSRPGSLQICAWETIKDDSTPDGCVTSTAGGTFQNAWFTGGWGAMIAQVTATPSRDFMDGVVGYSVGPADAYNDYATSIRFWTNGQIEARDGDVYRATTPLRYVAGKAYNFTFVVDFATATYSVYVMPSDSPYEATLLAETFKFRPQQAGIPMVNNVATIVASSAGQVKACAYRTTSPSGLVNIRSGRYSLGRFADGRVVLSNASGTQIVDAAGKTVTTSAVQLQQIATDADGNIYNGVVSDTNWTTLTLQSFTSALQPRWTRTFAVDTGPQEIGAYGNGVLGIVVDRGGTLLNVRTSDGAELSRIDLRAYQPMAVAIGPGRFAFAWRSGTDGIVQMHAVDGTRVWERRWTGNFYVQKMAIDEGGGVVFGGSFGDGGIDFGAGWYEPYYSSEVQLNGYIVSLASNGTLRYAKRHYAPGPDSLSAAGSMVAYATTQTSQTPHMLVFAYDIQGGEHQTGNVGLVDDSTGYLGDALVASDGRVLLNASLRMHPSAGAIPMSVLATLVYP
jgi:hypothetical protein